MRRSFVMAAIPLMTAAGPQRDLGSDLKNLNVRHRTEHYALAGTVSDAELAHYGQALEFVHREYARGFGNLRNGNNVGWQEPEDARFSVVILATASEYAEFAKGYFEERAEHTAGMFVPNARLLIILARNREETYGTLFHEAFHQFAWKHAPAIPIWIDEGLATYYGTARPIQDGLVFDRPRSHYFRLVQNAVVKAQLVPLQELMESSQEAFYDLSPLDGLGTLHRTLCYAQSYTLTSYLINDSGGRKHLRSYLRRLSGVSTSRKARKVTSEMFTDELRDAMIRPWIAHVARTLSGR